MGTNCGSVQVKLPPGSSYEAVLEAISASYLARGAKLGPAVHRNELEPLHVTKASGTTALGVAVEPPVEGWILIIDSERYSADAALAKDLAQRLQTTVLWEIIGDVSGRYQLVRYGPSFPASSAPRNAHLAYYDHLEPAGEHRAWAFLSFENLPVDAYAAFAHEVPRVSITCDECEQTTDWQAGVEDESMRDALVSEPSETRLHHRTFCSGCGGSLWLELEVDNCVVIGARPGEAPSLESGLGEEKEQVVVWLDSSGRGQPYGRADLVSLNPVAALLDLARDDRNLGLGLLKGRVDAGSTFGLMNQGRLLSYWTRAEFFELFRSEAIVQAADPGERERLERADVSSWPAWLPLMKRVAPTLSARLSDCAGERLLDVPAED